MEEFNLWTENKKIEPTLFSDKAEELAKKLAADNLASKNKKANKRTQIRRFYDEVLRLDTEAKARKEQWDDILPRLHMLTAKAAYAKGRELVSETFVNLVRSAINQVKEPEDLAVFANFFEAIMGFYRQHGPAN